MDEKDLRLICLQMAIPMNGAPYILDHAIKEAKIMYDFVSGKSEDAPIEAIAETASE